MTFKLINTEGETFTPTLIYNYEISFSVDAPCNAVRLYFLYDGDMGETQKVLIYNGNNLIFNGLCDEQKLTETAEGTGCFIYARGMCAVLIDNEAEPMEYDHPSAKELFFNNARAFGFSEDLPDIYSEFTYSVSKGTSVFGAINDFVLMQTGVPVFVDEAGTVRCFERGNTAKDLQNFNVVSKKTIIDRSDLVSLVHYKIDSSEGYIRHFKSEFLERQGIDRERFINLTSYPEWQREFLAENEILEPLKNYYQTEAKLFGTEDICLFDTFLVDGDTFTVYDVTYLKDDGGEFTEITLKKDVAGEIINYVAK